MLHPIPTASSGIFPVKGVLESNATSDYLGFNKTYTKGELIYLFRDQLLKVLIIEKGFVRVGIYTEDGEETTTAVLKPGDLFGSFLARHHQNEFAQALTEVQVKVIDQATFDRLLTVRSSFVYDFINMLGDRFQQLEHQFMMMNAVQARERIIAFLQFLAHQCGDRRIGAIIIHNFLTQQDLAAITNTSRQTISTYLSRLQEEGKLRYTRRQVMLLPTFPDYDRLREQSTAV